MELKTNYKTINLRFTTRKIVKISSLLKGKNFEDLYFKAINENDLDALSKIIFIFAEDEAGVAPFKNSEEVYDFIDDYKQEQNKSYDDIFKEIAEVINSEGFFKTKMSKEELTNKILDPLSLINMDEVIKTSTEKAMSKVVEAEAFKGYKG